MIIETGRHVGRVWLVAAGLFLATVGVDKLLGQSSTTRWAALVIGYIGLAGVGAALLVTSRWVDRHGPASMAARGALYVGIAAALVLWLLAIIFPFL